MILQQCGDTGKRHTCGQSYTSALHRVHAAHGNNNQRGDTTARFRVCTEWTLPPPLIGNSLCIQDAVASDCQHKGKNNNLDTHKVKRTHLCRAGASSHDARGLQQTRQVGRAAGVNVCTIREQTVLLAMDQMCT